MNYPFKKFDVCVRINFFYLLKFKNRFYLKILFFDARMKFIFRNFKNSFR
jgi:hypothetical protein